MNRTLTIFDSNDNVTAIVHFSQNITENISSTELLKKGKDNIEKAFYVFINGDKGFDWLWFYGDLVSIADIL